MEKRIPTVEDLLGSPVFEESEIPFGVKVGVLQEIFALFTEQGGADFNWSPVGKNREHLTGNNGKKIKPIFSFPPDGKNCIWIQNYAPREVERANLSYYLSREKELIEERLAWQGTSVKSLHYRIVTFKENTWDIQPTFLKLLDDLRDRLFNRKEEAEQEARRQTRRLQMIESTIRRVTNKVK